MRAIQITLGSYTIILIAIVTRFLAMRYGWLQPDFISPLRMSDFIDILTVWILPCYCGAWIAENKSKKPLEWSLAFGSFLILIAFTLERCGTSLGEEYCYGAPLSLITGGILYILSRTWTSSGTVFVSNTTHNEQYNFDVSLDAKKAWRILLVGIVVIAALIPTNRVLLEKRYTLPLATAKELSGYHAIMFTLPTCHFCQEIRPVLSDYQRRYPNLRVKVIDQSSVEYSLMRDRMNALYRVPQSLAGAVPILFGPTNYKVGASPIKGELDKYVGQPTSTLQSKLEVCQGNICQ